MTLFPQVLKQMHEKGIGDKPLFGGGIISEEDVKELEKHGVCRIFGPGSTTQSIIDYIRQTVRTDDTL